jgi:hypothetical protein
MAELSAREQLFVELINRARMDPLGEAARYGLGDLNAGLPPGTISAAPKQVLAPNFLLNDAARAHSQWQLDTDVFSHTGAGATSPGQRMTNASYTFSGSWSWGENISWSGSTGSFDANAAVAEQHRGLFLSAGHRENILGDSFREVGIGALAGQFTPGGGDPRTYNALMTTEDFARSGTKVFVTGVSYNDNDGNKFYSMGEGVAGRAFELLSGNTVTGSAAGMSAGGYAIGVTATGVMELRVTGAGLAADIGASFTLGGANVKIDLTGSGTLEANTSITLTRATPNLTLLGLENLSGTGNGFNNVIVGNAGSNTLSGGAGADTLSGGPGNDNLNGGSGVDTASFSGAFRLYNVSGNPTSGATVSGPDGSDSVNDVETLSFVDGARSHDATASVWQIQRLYGSAFDRTADALGLNFHAGRLDAGAALTSVAQEFAGSAEFLATYGSLSNSQFVNQLYLNVLDRPADAGGLAYWAGQLNSGAMTRGAVLVGFSESTENIGNDAGQLAAGQWDIDETAARIARLYWGTLDRAPDAGGLATWTNQQKMGVQTLSQAAGSFVGSPEFQATYGNLNNSQFVTRLYQNALDRAPDAGGLAHWTGLLNAGMPRADVVLGFTESSEHQIKTIGAIDNGITLF